MGVKGLQSYLEYQCKDDACKKVDIRDLVASYVQATKKTPVVVVDGLCIIRYLHKDSDWVCGGQLKEFFEAAKKFATSFQNLGIHLVFFFDGPTANIKRQTWIERRSKNVKDVEEILKMISNGTSPSRVPETHFMLPAGLSAMIRWVFQIACGCEVHFSIKECDEEITKYACQNKCFAVLSQDSDFVIYDGAEYYLSMKHLDIDTMTTLNYSRRELATKLGLHVNHLPLLASLMGNDIVDFHQLKAFHHKVLRSSWMDFSRLVPEIAKYIRKFPTGDKLLECLPEIAEYALRDRSKAELLMSSIKSYSFDEDETKDDDPYYRSNNTKWNQILKEAKNRHRNGLNHSYIFTVLFDFPYEQATSIEDYTNVTGIPPSAKVLRPLRQRIYGILLKEKGVHGENKVKEWCVEGPGSFNSYKVVDPIPPTVTHPGLLTLWQSDDESVHNLKWKLFGTSVSSRLNTEKLRKLPKFLVLPTAALYYLKEEAKLDIQPWEINALLATAVVLEYYDSNQLYSLNVDTANMRAVVLATVYLRAVTVLNVLLNVCGFPIPMGDSLPWLYFDGKLFQMKYQEAKKRSSVSQLCEHRDSARKKFELAREII